jgi:hypothetical protein
MGGGSIQQSAIVSRDPSANDLVLCGMHVSVNVFLVYRFPIDSCFFFHSFNDSPVQAWKRVVCVFDNLLFAYLCKHYVGRV